MLSVLKSPVPLNFELKLDKYKVDIFSAYEDPTTLVNDCPIDACEDVYLIVLTKLLNTALLECNGLIDCQSERTHDDDMTTMKMDEKVANKLKFTPVDTEDALLNGEKGNVTEMEYNYKTKNNDTWRHKSTRNNNDSENQEIDFKSCVICNRSPFQMSIPTTAGVNCKFNMEKYNKKNTHPELLKALKKEVNVRSCKNSIVMNPKNMYQALRNLAENKLQSPMPKEMNRYIEEKRIVERNLRTDSKYRRKQAPSSTLKKISKKYTKEYGNSIRSFETKRSYLKTKTSRNKINNVQASNKIDNNFRKKRAITRVRNTRKFNKKRNEISTNSNERRKEYYKNDTQYHVGDSIRTLKEKKDSRIISRGRTFTEISTLQCTAARGNVSQLKRRESNRANIVPGLIRNGSDNLKVKQIEYERSDSEASAQYIDFRNYSNTSTNLPQSRRNLPIIVRVPTNNLDSKVLNFKSMSNTCAKITNSINKSNISIRIPDLTESITPTKMINVRRNSKAFTKPNLTKDPKSRAKVTLQKYDTNRETANVANDLKTYAKRERDFNAKTSKYDTHIYIKLPKHNVTAKRSNYEYNSKTSTDISISEYLWNKTELGYINHTIPSRRYINYKIKQ